MRKGKYHKLADDALVGDDVGPGDDIVVLVEGVGLNVGLSRDIAAEVRADAIAGYGRVNVFMSMRVCEFEQLGRDLYECANLLFRVNCYATKSGLSGYYGFD